MKRTQLLRLCPCPMDIDISTHNSTMHSLKASLSTPLCLGYSKDAHGCTCPCSYPNSTPDVSAVLLARALNLPCVRSELAG